MTGQISEFVQEALDCAEQKRAATGRGSFYDMSQAHGAIVAHGPGATRAIEQFNHRQRERARIGIWRAGCNHKLKNDGEYIDPDWYVVPV